MLTSAGLSVGVLFLNFISFKLICSFFPSEESLSENLFNGLWALWELEVLLLQLRACPHAFLGHVGTCHKKAFIIL